MSKTKPKIGAVVWFQHVYATTPTKCVVVAPPSELGGQLDNISFIVKEVGGSQLQFATIHNIVPAPVEETKPVPKAETKPAPKPAAKTESKPAPKPAFYSSKKKSGK